MRTRSRGGSLVFAFVGALVVIHGGIAATAHAQVTCYLKKCAEYADGTRICIRTPIDCGTVQL